MLRGSIILKPILLPLVHCGSRAGSFGSFEQECRCYPKGAGGMSIVDTCHTDALHTSGSSSDVGGCNTPGARMVCRLSDPGRPVQNPELGLINTTAGTLVPSKGGKPRITVHARRCCPRIADPISGKCGVKTGRPFLQLPVIQTSFPRPGPVSRQRRGEQTEAPLRNPPPGSLPALQRLGVERFAPCTRLQNSFRSPRSSQNSPSHL